VLAFGVCGFRSCAGRAQLPGMTVEVLAFGQTRLVVRVVANVVAGCSDPVLAQGMNLGNDFAHSIYKGKAKKRRIHTESKP
jgi:hypothetical protein